MESENTAYSSCNEDSRAGQGAEEKCVSPPWGVNLSSLLDPWKQTNTAFSRLSKKRAKRDDLYSKWQPWRRMFINIVEQTGRRTLQSSHLITQCLCICVCVCVFLNRIKVYKAPGAVCLGEVSTDSKTPLIILRWVHSKRTCSAAKNQSPHKQKGKTKYNRYYPHFSR